MPPSNSAVPFVDVELRGGISDVIIHISFEISMLRILPLPDLPRCAPMRPAYAKTTPPAPRLCPEKTAFCPNGDGLRPEEKGRKGFLGLQGLAVTIHPPGVRCYARMGEHVFDVGLAFNS